MLGMGWLANQFGKFGNTIRGGADQLRQKIGGVGQYRTPDFNPNASGIGAGDEMPAMRPLSTSVQPGDIPTSVPYRGTGASAMLAPSPQTGAQTIPMPNVYRRELPGARVEDVPIPSLPGIPGGKQAYDPIAEERYDYIYGRMPKHEVEHTGADGSTYTINEERKPTFGERFKSALLPTLAGVARGAAASPSNPLAGAAGGAVAGLGLNLANPNMGSMLSFNTFTEPRLQADQQRQDMQYHRGIDRERAGLGMEQDRASLEYRRAQTDALKENTQANIAYKQSQVAANDALAKARLTGKAERFRQYDPTTGEIYEAFRYPDGRTERAGLSGDAQIKREGYENQRGIADNRNTTQVTVADKRGANALAIAELKDRGQTGRTAMVQAGQDRRLKEQPGATGGKIPAVGSVPFQPPVGPPAGTAPRKTATRDHVAQYAKQNGISYAEAQRIAESKGYTVQ